MFHAPSPSQLLKEEQLSLDGLFALSSANLGALAERLGLAREEEGKLKTYLNLLACCYSESFTPPWQQWSGPQLTLLGSVVLVTNGWGWLCWVEGERESFQREIVAVCDYQ